MQKYLIEFLGTFFLVLTIALTGEPIAIGAILIAMVYMGGYISGGHFNPAVTMAVLVRGRLDVGTALRYMLVQVVGGLVAALVFEVIKESLFIPAPASGVTTYAAFMVEFLFTFALGMVVLNVATSDKVKGNYYYGIAIGLTVMAAAYAGGKISGGVYNPAVAIGPILADATNVGTNLNNLILYIAAPILGGAVAGFVYNFIHGEPLQIKRTP